MILTDKKCLAWNIFQLYYSGLFKLMYFLQRRNILSLAKDFVLNATFQNFPLIKIINQHKHTWNVTSANLTINNMQVALACDFFFFEMQSFNEIMFKSFKHNLMEGKSSMFFNSAIKIIFSSVLTALSEFWKCQFCAATCTS